MSEKDQLSILRCLSICSMIGISLLCLFTWPTSDDFSFYLDLKNRSIFEQALFMYKHWDGRSLNIHSYLQNFLLKYCDARISTLIWSFFFLANTYLLLCIIEKEFKLKVTDRIVSWGFLSVVLWLSFYSHISQTVYWTTGGAYSASTTIMLLWLNWVLKIFESNGKNNKITILGIFLLSVSAGNVSTNLFPALILFLIFTFYKKWIAEKQTRFIPLTIFSGLIIGGTVLFVSPGNYNRATFGPNTLQFFTLAYFHQVAFFIAYYGYISIVLILLSVFAPIYFIAYSNPQLLLSQEKNWNMILKDKWLWMALSTLLIFFLIPDFVSARTSIYFMFFVFLFVFSVVYVLLVSNKIKVINKNIFSKLLILFFSIHLIVLFYHYYAAIKIGQELSQREKYCLNQKNKGKDITVSPIKQYIPFALKFDDISTDRNFWINKTVARYYGLNSIQIEESTLIKERQ